MSILCVVGLGNPGVKYAETRHNAGFWFVDEVARCLGGQFRAEVKFHGEVCRVSIDDRECWLLKPMTFMNRSGQSVSAFSNFYKVDPDKLLVAHDELDMPPGIAKLKRGGGHGGHNGLRDTTSALGSGDFTRLRVGIGHPGHRDMVSDYVLNRPSKTDEQLIRSALDRAVEVLPLLLAGELQKAMHRLHSVAD